MTCENEKSKEEDAYRAHVAGSRVVRLTLCRFAGASPTILGSSWAVLGASWGPLGATWGPLGRFLGPLGSLLGAFWCLLGVSLGGKLEMLVRAPSLGPLLGRSWSLFGPSWRPPGPSGVPLAGRAPSWGPLRPSWGDLWSLLGRFGAWGSRKSGNTKNIEKPKGNATNLPRQALLEALLEASWGVLEGSRAVLGAPWAVWTAESAARGPLGPSCGPSWGRPCRPKARPPKWGRLPPSSAGLPPAFRAWPGPCPGGSPPDPPGEH